MKRSSSTCLQAEWKYGNITNITDIYLSKWTVSFLTHWEFNDSQIWFNILGWKINYN